MKVGPSENETAMDAPTLALGTPTWGYLPQRAGWRDRVSRAVGHPHPYGRLRARSVVPLLDASLRTLDLGCGEGVFTRELRLRGMEVVGLDLDASAVAAARRNMGLLGIEYEALCADAQDVPFEDGSFDQVISTDVLEHVPSPEQAMREVFRLLRPGGKFVATVPTPLYLSEPIVPADFSAQLEEIGHLHAGWYEDEARAMFEGCGFTVESTHYFGHTPIRLALECLYALAGEKGVRSTRKSMYSVGLSAFAVYAALVPLMAMERLYNPQRKAAFLVIEARRPGHGR